MKSQLIQLAANIVAINDMSRAFPAFDPNARHGMVMCANDANFDASFLSEPLSEYLVDTPDAEGLDTVLENAFPSVLTGRAFQYLTHENTEAFQADLSNEDIREIGGKFAEVPRTGTRVDGRTDNKGLTMILDNDQGGDDPAIQQAAVANLRNRLFRSELYRGEVLLEANDSGPTTPNWGGTNTSADPDGDLATAIDAGGDARGINSNVALYGGGAWLKRFLSLGLGDNAGRHQTRNMTPEQLAQLVGLEAVIKSNFRYQSSGTAKTKIVADKVFCYYAKKGASRDDPSNIKRFVTPVPGGGAMRVYIETVLKRTSVTVEHYSRIAITSTLGIRKIAPTYS